ESSRPRIAKGMANLDGQALVKVSGGRGGKWLFEFDLGGKLETRTLDRNMEQWFLSDLSGYTLSMRGDGKYCYMAPGTVIRDAKWRILK
ncbi:hypothetical protein, partial [Klebsiella aerogenes]|uniref:hypothetical protein n=1 Tax=Klebsiella aerogenes TaxID=548 RepID=UPI001CC6E5E0